MSKAGSTPGAARGRSARRRLVPLMAAMMILVAACGTNTGSASGGANLPGEPIVLGVMVNESGPTGATESSALRVLEAWAAHTNESGGIAGSPVELIVKDTRGDAPTAVTAAQELVADRSVDAVVHLSTVTEGAVGEVFANSDLAVVGGAGYNPQVWHALPNWYGITTSFPSVVNMQVRSAVNAGASRLAAIVCAEDPSCLQAIPVFEAAAQQYGVDYVGVIQVAATAPNYTAECLEIIDRGADFVQLSATQATVPRVATDCLQQGYGGYFGASAGSVTAAVYEAVPGIRLAGGLNAFPWYVDAEPVQDYRDAMKAQGVDQEDWAQPTSTAAWATGELFRTALAGLPEGAEVTRTTVVEAYGAIENETLGGLLPNPVTFDAGEPAPPVRCYWLYTYENGEFSGDFEPECPPDRVGG